MFASLMTDLIGVDCEPMASVGLARDYGFDGVDFRINRWADAIEQSGVRPLNDAMDDAGLARGYCSLLPKNMGVDDEAWADGIAALPRLAKLAQQLGFVRTSTVVLPFHKTMAMDAAMEQHVSRVSQAMKILRDFGLRLGLEYVSPRTRRAGQPYEFVHRMDQMLAMVDACGDGVGLMLDSFHWHCAGETVTDLKRLCAEQVVVVHVNDALAGIDMDEQVVTSRELPGVSGVIDLAGFVGSLRAIGYDGPMTAEPTHARWKNSDATERSRRHAVEQTSRAMRGMLSQECWS